MPVSCRTRVATPAFFLPFPLVPPVSHSSRHFPFLPPFPPSSTPFPFLPPFPLLSRFPPHFPPPFPLLPPSHHFSPFPPFPPSPSPSCPSLSHSPNLLSPSLPTFRRGSFPSSFSNFPFLCPLPIPPVPASPLAIALPSSSTSVLPR
ncbi:unnamed protein product [Closterium sp. NIES-65]|nr:unnamed protein product [Closterium sp. NIES-65]